MEQLKYRCPDCRRGLVFSDRPIEARITAACPRCRRIVAPTLTGPQVAEFACGGCGRIEWRERPPGEYHYCAPCGRSMRPVAPKKTKHAEPTRAAIGHMR